MKRLYLSTDKKISGVCGGIAEYFGVDPTLIRLGWVAAAIISGLVPGLLIYIIAAVVIPHRPEDS